MSKHVILLDASGFMYRAYHGGPAIYRESDGLPTWAVTGFLAMVWKILGDAQADRPTHGAAVFDHPSKTFRHRLYAGYKANRPAKSEELTAQMPLMRIAADVMGLTPIEVKGFEADDVLATLAATAVAQGFRVTLVSSDKDFAQLVRDGHIEIVDPIQKVRVLERDVEKKFGVPPALMTDLQALAGDAVDGIPGVSTIGLKKGAALIRRFGGIDEIYKRLDEVPAWARVHLERQRKDVDVFRNLVTLRRDVPMDVSIDSLAAKPVVRAHLMELLKALEAAPRFAAIFGEDRQLIRYVDAVKGDALEWWRAALKGFRSRKLPDVPQCGYYQRRIVKGGVLVPCRIWRESETDLETGKPTGRDMLMCEVAGKREDAVSQWGRLCSQPIHEHEYRHLMKVQGWAKQHAPDDPMATPGKPVDFNKTPIPW